MSFAARLRGVDSVGYPNALANCELIGGEPFFICTIVDSVMGVRA